MAPFMSLLLCMTIQISNMNNYMVIAQCVFQSGNHTLDLTPLEGVWVSSTGVFKNTYNMTICENPPNSCIDGNANSSSMVYAYSSYDVASCYTIATWNEDDKPIIVLLHGYGGSGMVFNKILSELH